MCTFVAAILIELQFFFVDSLATCHIGLGPESLNHEHGPRWQRLLIIFLPKRLHIATCVCRRLTSPAAATGAQ